MITTLGTELPIIQAPMAGVQDHRLAVAVADSGGLGSIPAAMLSLEQLRQELSRFTAKTSQPLNVNFFCHTPPTPDLVVLEQWQQILAPYYAEYGISLDTIIQGAGRVPFNQDYLDLIAEFKPAVVSFHFGLPDETLLAPIRAWGGKIIASATTLAEGYWLAQRGVDAIIAQGLEAGGHRGHFLSHNLTEQMGTFALVSQLSKVLDIPIIAAGGIATNKDVKAALTLGASMVQVGTAYLLSPEATTSTLHRQVLQSDQVLHTALTNLFTGRPARGVVNRLMRELGYLNTEVPPFPLATNAIAPLRAAAEKVGKTDFSPLWVGQNASQCQLISAGTLTRILAL